VEEKISYKGRLNGNTDVIMLSKLFCCIIYKYNILKMRGKIKRHILLAKTKHKA